MLLTRASSGVAAAVADARGSPVHYATTGGRGPQACRVKHPMWDALHGRPRPRTID